jgi:hypothetical protein
MSSRLRLSLILLPAIAALSPHAFAQDGPPKPPGPPQTVSLHGTIGQQKVSMTIQFVGDEVKTAQYQYDSQKDVVPLSEGKFYGTTVILADDDGNVLHLHLLRADGVATGTVKETAAVDGTMNRGDDLELPIKMERLKN